MTSRGIEDHQRAVLQLLSAIFISSTPDGTELRLMMPGLMVFGGLRRGVPRGFTEDLISWTHLSGHSSTPPLGLGDKVKEYLTIASVPNKNQRLNRSIIR